MRLKAFRYYSSGTADRWRRVFVKESHLATLHGRQTCQQQQEGPQRCINACKETAFREPANPNYTHTLLIDSIKKNVAGTQMHAQVFQCDGTLGGGGGGCKADFMLVKGH